MSEVDGMERSRALASYERMADKLRGTVAGQTDDPEHLLDVLIAAWEEMHREANQQRGAVETVTHAIVMLGGLAEPWDQLDYAERCARAENELRALLDRLGGR